MIENYKVKLGDDNGLFWWEVIETKTGHVIKSFDFEEDAIEYSLFLMRGGAFDGFTPRYILEGMENNVFG